MTTRTTCRAWSWMISAAVLATAVGCGSESEKTSDPRSQTVDAERTAAYVTTLDLRAIELRGSDFTSPRFDPTRIGKPREEIDPDCEYDFVRLAEVEERLRGVDRRKVLEHIFAELTAGVETNTEKHLALLKFLHRASFHSSRIRPMYEDCIRCWDPVVILELNEMHCTHVGRLVVDLWEAGGYQARAGFGAKTSAEVFYDDAWHFFGADSCGGNGITLFKDDGTIPSWVELSERPEWIDVLPYRYELKPNGAPKTRGTPVRSTNCFFDTKGDRRKYFRKVRPAIPGEFNYGWQELALFPADWILYEHREPPHQPGAVVFGAISVSSPGPGARAAIEIEWKPAFDKDDDVLGYRVYVSSTPRGWSYSKFAGTQGARKFWSTDQGWRPEMYDALYRLPPHDVDLLEVTEPRVQLELDAGARCFVTVMAFDEYHERIGKELYLMSNELQLDASADSPDR